MELKLGDIYSFRYKYEYIKDKAGDPYHCLDGQLIVKKDINDKLYLQDTYWGGISLDDDYDSRVFTLESALKLGELEFICNIENIERIKEYEMDFYADEDAFNLSHQHRCYKAYYKKKDSQKCPKKMEEVLLYKIERAKSEIKSKEIDINRFRRELETVREGKTEGVFM
ncbi:hypothetical protein ACR77J_07590 [Tissierella praeacuta]|uniref:hypothetical protein n=1 Tax=Tissierella praeacuta TaxID=43131 RepID=UPI003DA34E61